MSKFAQQITAFNQMYGLPVNFKPVLLGIQRLHDFKHALQNELNEIDAIIGQYEHASSTQHGSAALEEHISDEQRFSILTNLADLLGDLQVYCASEMAKWGIPLDGTLDIIMASNMSKLGADGKPIVDERGKVQKGPNYWKPEPKIAALLTITSYFEYMDGGKSNMPNLHTGYVSWSPNEQFENAYKRRDGNGG